MVLLDAAAATVPRDQLLVATYDHGTGTAATAALELVERCAGALGIEFVGGQTSVPLETEAELRDARWAFLRATAEKANAVISTAHSSDDQVETILMRVLRDAGARGLAGLFAESDVVRPLLRLTRRDLARYARAQGLTWVEDPSNTSPRFLRNRVRHDLLPALRHVRLGIDADLLALARKAARWRTDVESFVATQIELRTFGETAGLDVCASALSARSVTELCILWPAIAAHAGLALDRRGIVRLAEFTKDGRVGSRIQLSGGWEVTRSRDALQLRASNEDKPTPEPLALSNDTQWGDWFFRPASQDASAEVGSDIGSDSWSAWLPIDRPLSVRIWEAGDAMASPDGSPPRKVKHFLSDAGVTGHERTGWPVVLAGDQIVWIPGVRRSDAATVRSGRPGLPFVCEYFNR
ncbi:MAG: tRNA(Ile)-lysidine synthase [Gemmatimonadetes bacterium]|nr:tRNA(Ile)-lysidine synthase [Gemmatimonadota bacterium]